MAGMFGSVGRPQVSPIGQPPGAAGMIAFSGKAGAAPGIGGALVGGLMAGTQGLMDTANAQNAADAANAQYLWRKEWSTQLELKKQAALETMKQIHADYVGNTPSAKLDLFTKEQAIKNENAPLPKDLQKRYAGYRDDILAASQKYGVPSEYLAGIIAQESGFNPSAIGDGGASVGMGQFNTKTGFGKELMQTLGLTKKQIASASPQQQIDWTAQYFSQVAQNFKDQNGNIDYAKALDAYNKGVGSVGSKSTGDPNYVSHVLRYANQFASLESTLGAQAYGKAQKTGATGGYGGYSAAAVDSIDAVQDPKSATRWFLSIKDSTDKKYLSTQAEKLMNSLPVDDSQIVRDNLDTAQLAALIAKTGNTKAATDALQPFIAKIKDDAASGKKTSATEKKGMLSRLFSWWKGSIPEPQASTGTPYGQLQVGGLNMNNTWQNYAAGNTATAQTAQSTGNAQMEAMVNKLYQQAMAAKAAGDPRVKDISDAQIMQSARAQAAKVLASASQQ